MIKTPHFLIRPVEGEAILEHYNGLWSFTPEYKYFSVSDRGCVGVKFFISYNSEHKIHPLICLSNISNEEQEETFKAMFQFFGHRTFAQSLQATPLSEINSRKNILCQDLSLSRISSLNFEKFIRYPTLSEINFRNKLLTQHLSALNISSVQLRFNNHHYNLTLQGDTQSFQLQNLFSPFREITFSESLKSFMVEYEIYEKTLVELVKSFSIIDDINSELLENISFKFTTTEGLS